MILPKNAKNLAGQRFGRLVAVEFKYYNDKHEDCWLFKCDCGNTVFYSVNRLTRGRTLSCGCLYHDTRGTCSENRSDAMEGTLLSTLVSSKNPHANNSSGHTGVYLDKRTGKWQAYINFQKKRYHLGMFKTKEQAIRVRKSAEKKLFDPLIQEQWERLTKESQQKYLAYIEANEEIQDGPMEIKNQNCIDCSFGDQR